MALSSWISTAAALALCACGGGSTDSEATGGADGESGGSGGETAAPTFVTDVAPIVKLSCSFQSCHGGGSAGLNLPADDPAGMFAALIDRSSQMLPDAKLVVPGDADASFLLAKIEGRQGAHDAQCIGGTCGTAMPQGGTLAADRQGTIRRWIEAGAPFGESGDGAAIDPRTLEPVDERIEMPAPDPDFLDFASAETVIPPGEERMFCTHVEYEGTEDTAFEFVDSQQGKYGHHVVLLGAKTPLPSGTLVDCTAAAEMEKYDAYTIGDQELPPGYGILLPKGKRMVVQSHYVNAGERPLLVRDVVRLKLIPVEQVQTWAAIYVTNSLNIHIPAGERSEVTFDCRISKDVDLVAVGGHMHEWGTRFSLMYGDDEESLTELYKVSEWVPEYRDSPPMNLYFEQPLHLKAGTLLRTHCEWRSDQPHELVFPHEMCTSFGYVGGSKDPEICSVE